MELDERNDGLDEVTGHLDEAELEIVSDLLEQKSLFEGNISEFKTNCRSEAAQLNAEIKRLTAEIENPAEESTQVKNISIVLRFARLIQMNKQPAFLENFKQLCLKMVYRNHTLLTVVDRL